MDREILLTGIGGQGVQLAAKTLALAGMLSGREVMQLSMFSGTMRGGSSECTVVVADGPVEAPPVVPWAWAAIAMHPAALELTCGKLREGGAVLFNQSLVAAPTGRPDCGWYGVEAGAIAAARGNPQGQSLVALGAFCALTGIVQREALEEGLAQSLPSYRRDNLARNVECIAAGAEAVAAVAGKHPAWNGNGAA
ncbi:MAG: hypothetical protein FJ144_07015 [Deltaproteobacteria bacterium]|nr:hypothetical protein [Deltaproteobacteria bacterium]